ncbi:MAG: hypothetical protein QG635_914 [Bacteroidota bacterium]|nr:hypothetical protein [Bacteroidota bacterium]
MKDPTQYFIDFLRGELDTDKEASMFSLLSQDENLRSELRCYVRINNSMKSGAVEAMPSASVSSNIFRQLGYNMPYISTLPIKVAKKSFLNKYWLTGFVSSITSIAITVAAFLLFFNKPAGETQLNPNIKQANSESKIGSENMPVFQSDINKDIIKTKIKQSLPNIVISENYENFIDTIENLSEEKVNKTLILPEKTNNKSYIVNTEKLFNSDKYIFSSYHQDISNDGMTKINSDIQVFNDNFSLEIRNSAFWNFPTETIYPGELSKFNNAGITIFYHISTNFSMGLDLRQETFYAVYEGIELDSHRYRYEQQPNFTSYGINLRYKFSALFGFEPLIQLNGGMNLSGYVIRPMIGLSYQIAGGISAMLGAEYCGMWYIHQNNWFSTSKAGILYGINYRF